MKICREFRIICISFVFLLLATGSSFAKYQKFENLEKLNFDPVKNLRRYPYVNFKAYAKVLIRYKKREDSFEAVLKKEASRLLIHLVDEFGGEPLRLSLKEEEIELQRNGQLETYSNLKAALGWPISQLDLKRVLLLEALVLPKKSTFYLDKDSKKIMIKSKDIIYEFSQVNRQLLSMQDRKAKYTATYHYLSPEQKIIKKIEIKIRRPKVTIAMDFLKSDTKEGEN